MNLGRFLEFFQDDTKALSSTRLAFLSTVFAVLAAWLFQCYNEGKLAPIDQSILYLIGILMMGKVSQSFGENGQSK